MVSRNHRRIILSDVLLILLFLPLSSCVNLDLGTGSAQIDPNELSSVVSESQSTEETGNAFKVEVGIEPTPVPTKHTYINEVYGFQVDYPDTWRIVELDHGVEIWKDAFRLLIRARWETEQLSPDFGMGLPAGDLVYRDKVSFLGEMIPVNHLVYEGKIKMVLYNEGRTILSDGLEILIILDVIQDSDYENIDIPIEVIDQTKSILESFQRLDGAAAPPVSDKGWCADARGNPPADWKRYQNQGYGFYLFHPQGVEVVEKDHVLELHQGDLIMRIEYRRLDEAYSLPGFELQGEVELTRFMNYFEEENPNPIVVERSDGRVTRVSVGNVITQTTPVQFLVSITDRTGNDINLEQANHLLEIVDYLCLSR